MKRYLEASILKDLSKKMVFLGGPRQVGKTTLAQHILKRFRYKKSKSGLYLNWDFDEDRQRIIKKQWDEDHQLLVFDELHKYSRWKNWIKGLYDKNRHQNQYFVTGSARMDLYQRGGDSLLGRYHYWRLHPLTLDELPPKMTQKEGFKRLMTLGGFPEPFLGGDPIEAQRWRQNRFDRILKEDVRDLESVKKIQDLSLFVLALRQRVAQRIVFSNLARDLEISFKTAKLWLSVLNRMYICFSIWPYTKNVNRSILKPPKVYFFDNADVIGDNEGPRFENLIACHLLKKIDYLRDSQGVSCELMYIADKEAREVDFIIHKEGKIFALIEAKLSVEKISRSLKYYSERLKPQHALQVVAYPKKEYRQGSYRVVSLTTALRLLFG